ncbi:glycoside hydrolase family 10 protein, partial [Anabaena sp. UHCC 0451]|nr:glycoside hydrolase family 10 protein [Anabaena sp. UHCC 0451]
MFNFWGILPANAATPTGVLNVIKSQENTQEWTEITKRLQTVGAKYCVIPLANIKNVEDLGQQRVLLLPNVETLTASQAMVLQEWMSRGGRLIASGPVGNLSSLGVRQALRNMLGGYWGFNLNDIQELQSAKTNTQAWANQTELFGKVLGAVMIADNPQTQTSAVWNSQNQSAAILTTERSTFLGWRWGTDKNSTTELDTAWLKALLNNYLKLATKPEVSPAQKCPPSSINITLIKPTAISNTNSRQPINQPRKVTV